MALIIQAQCSSLDSALYIFVFIYREDFCCYVTDFCYFSGEKKRIWNIAGHSQNRSRMTFLFQLHFIDFHLINFLSGIIPVYIINLQTCIMYNTPIDIYVLTTLQLNLVYFP